MLYGILIFRCSSRLETRAKMEEIADTEWDVHCVETGFEVGWGASRLKWMCEHVVHFGMRWNVLRRAKRTNENVRSMCVCACVVLQATTMMTRAAIALMAWWNIIYDYYQMVLFFGTATVQMNHVSSSYNNKNYWNLWCLARDIFWNICVSIW